MNTKFKRFIVVTCLVTFLFLPLQKPQKANAFAIPVVAVPFLEIIGGTVLAWAGCTFVDQQMARAEGHRLIYTNAFIGTIEFKCKPLLGDAYWKTASEMTDDDWGRWTKEYHVTPKTYAFIETFKDLIPKEPVETILSIPGNALTITGGEKRFYITPRNADGVCNFTVKNLYSNIDYPGTVTLSAGKENDVSARFYQNDFYLYDYSAGTGSVIYRQWVSIAGASFIPLDFDISEKKTIPYTPEVSAGLSKDTLAEKMPVDTSYDVSNATSIPLSKDQSLENTGIKEQVKDPSITVDNDVITGWGWLDKILTKILDAILSIPGAIKDGIASLFIPTLDLSDIGTALCDKFNIPTIDFPTFTDSSPLILDYDLSNVLPGFKIYKPLDWEFFSTLRSWLLGLEVFIIIYFFGKKISALHGGSGD